MNTQKLCKDCKWMDQVDAVCCRLAPSFSLVWGRREDPILTSCYTERTTGPLANLCGPEGRYWEAKDQPKPEPAKKGAKK